MWSGSFHRSVVTEIVTSNGCFHVVLWQYFSATLCRSRSVLSIRCHQILVCLDRVTTLFVRDGGGWVGRTSSLQFVKFQRLHQPHVYSFVV